MMPVYLIRQWRRPLTQKTSRRHFVELLLLVLIGCALFVCSTPMAAQNVTGTVFEDTGYSGGSGRSLASSGGTGVGGVTIEVYRLNSGSYRWQRAVTTAANGTYSIAVSKNSNYILRVVNTTVNSNRAGSTGAELGVQTFRSTVSGFAGVGDTERVGGEAPQLADTVVGTSTTTIDPTTFIMSNGGQAQSVTGVFAVGGTSTSITGVDFGFNFSTIVNTNSTGQGSLAQWIANTNLLGGGDRSIFMITDGAAHNGLRSGLTNQLTGNVAVIKLTAAATLSASGSLLDGSTQATNIGNTNSASLGTGGTVGTSNQSLPLFSGPEVELQSNTGADVALSATGSGVQISKLALHQVAINLSGSNTLAQDNVVGMHADGTATTSLQSIGITIGAATGIKAIHNYVKTNNSGIRRDGNGSAATIQYNEVNIPTAGQTNTFDGILLIGSGTSSGDLIQYNLIQNMQGGGIEVGFNGGITLTNALIDNNTITHNGYSGATASTEPIDIAAYQLNTGSTLTVSHNVITNSGGPGIILMQAQNVKITQNSIHTNGVAANNGPGIQLDKTTRDPNSYGTAPGPTANTGVKACGTVPNCGMNYPVFTAANLDTTTNQLHLKGFVGSAAGQSAFANASIELFKADNNPANQNGAIIAGDGKNVAHGEGTTYMGTFTADASGNFDVRISAAGWSSTDVITATATDTTSNTSEFSANTAITLVTTISGAIYSDPNHNGVKDTGEDWAAGPATPIFVNLVQGGAVIQSVSVTGGSAGSGSFTITDVPAGTFTVVVTNSATSVTPVFPASFVAVSPRTAQSASIVIPATPTPVTGTNFGFFKGSAISLGTVFKDTGDTGGTANNGIQDGAETGISAITVKAVDTATKAVIYDTTTTDATGKFTLYIASTVTTAVDIIRVASGYQATGGNAGTTTGTYTRATESIANFIPVAGTAYTGVTFGSVPANTFTNDNATNLQAGTSTYYPHTFTAGTIGSVTFTTSAVITPAQTAWTEVVYRDKNCTGIFDAVNDTVISGAQAIAAPGPYCILVKETLPTGVNGTNTVTVSANFTYTNASPALSNLLTHTDTTTAGYSISGAVYNDANHNSTKDVSEVGTGLTLYAKLVKNGATTATAVATVDTSTSGGTSGTYSFASTPQPAGTYSIVLSTNNVATDITAITPSGWMGTQNASGTIPVTIAAADISNQFFGLYQGSAISGTVFADNGLSGGIANNGIKDGGETGLGSVTITATNGATVYDTQTTAASGTFTVWIPSTASTVTITRVATTGYLATGGSAGTTGGTYSRTSETVNFTAAAGTIYTGVLFGDVQVNTLSNDNSGTLQQGNSNYYPHTFVAGSTGTVTFSTSAVSNPTLSGWVEAIYIDSNCNGTFDTGEPLATAQSVSAGSTICLLVKETSPATGTGQNTVTLQALMTYSNASPALSAALTRQDVTSSATGPIIRIQKSVDKVQAYPGDTLTYTITYTNIGGFPAQQMVINDSVPSSTRFVSASCGTPLPAALTACTVTQSPAVGGTGAVAWTFTGTLSPNGTGTVTFLVKVN